MFLFYFLLYVVLGTLTAGYCCSIFKKADYDHIEAVLLSMLCGMIFPIMPLVPLFKLGSYISNHRIAKKEKKLEEQARIRVELKKHEIALARIEKQKDEEEDELINKFNELEEQQIHQTKLRKYGQKVKIPVKKKR